MFREMRRQDRAMSREDAEQLLLAQSHGVLACLGDNGYPYAVPLNYLYDRGRIYFHSAAGTGHKLAAIAQEPKASFCVVGLDQVVPERETTLYASVIAFGRARVVADEAEKREAIYRLLDKFCGEAAKVNGEYPPLSWDKFDIVALEIEHLSGKANPE